MTDFREQPLGKIDLGDGHFISVHIVHHADGGDERVGLAIGTDTEFLVTVLDPDEAELLAGRIFGGAQRCRALRNIDAELARLAQDQ